MPNLQDENELHYYLDFIMNIANQLTIFEVEKEDLFQEGYFGLMEASQRYTVDKNIAFIDFAYDYIILQMIKFIKNEECFEKEKEQFSQRWVNDAQNTDLLETIHLHSDLYRCLKRADLGTNEIKYLSLTYGSIGVYSDEEKASEIQVIPKSVKGIEERFLAKIRLRSAQSILEYADNPLVAQDTLETAKILKRKTMHRGMM